MVPECGAKKVIASGPAAVAIVNPADCFWAGELLSLTVTVKVDVPFVVGVPEMTPAAEMERPTGSCPEASDHE
jgi:hypothetical protein